MKVVLRNPRRELEVTGPKTVTKLLAELDVNPESVLVIADDELVPKDARLADAMTVEIRPVISGGAGGATDGGCATSGIMEGRERPGAGGATDGGCATSGIMDGRERPGAGGAA